MSAPSRVDADKAALIRFGYYGYLPAELRIKIIHGFIVNFRKQSPTQRLSPFAVLDSEWQHELEQEEELWGRLRLTTNDLPTYRSMLNPRRGGSLSSVALCISIDNNVIEPKQQDDETLNYGGLRSRVGNSVVQAVSTLFECVNYAKSTRPQPARKGVKFHIQITLPEAISRGDAGYFLHKTEIDFSGLPRTDVICEFSQGRVWALKKNLSKDGRLKDTGLMLLNRSSLLCLFGRMPNLEHAQVHLDIRKTTPVGAAPELNNCPRLETLSLSSLAYGCGSLPGSALSGWVSNWSHKIKSLNLCRVRGIPEFLRSLPNPGPGTDMITWPNLEALHVAGRYHPALGMGGQGDHMDNILSAVPAALASLPRIRNMLILLTCPNNALADINIGLKLQPDSSKLVIWMRDVHPELRIKAVDRMGPDTPQLLREEAKLWDLADEEKSKSALKNIRAAVAAQHGLHLEIKMAMESLNHSEQQCDWEWLLPSGFGRSGG